MAKEEENYNMIVNLKEENNKLQKQIKQAAATQAKPNNDREVAKLSVENDMLKK